MRENLGKKSAIPGGRRKKERKADVEAVAREVRVDLPNGAAVSALLNLPVAANRLLVLAHGAGAGMTHPFLEALSKELNSTGIATFRYQFPYMEEHRRMPDSPSLLTATVAAAVNQATKLAPNLPVFAGGKSMGGRMTSTAASEGLLGTVRGLIFFGFPLHPPNRPGTTRAEHLARVRVPMLFLQGSRDAFAEVELLSPVCEELGELATLKVIEGGDHSFHVLKSSGKTDGDAMSGMVKDMDRWTRGVLDGA